MRLSFTDLLHAAGIDPTTVRLLRHRNTVGRTPYAAWFGDRPAFEAWQAYQKSDQAAHFRGAFWASFVATPDGGTMFAGMYAVSGSARASDPVLDHLRGDVATGGPYDRYDLAPVPALADFAGRLFVEWPVGRNWRRLGSGSGYFVSEIRRAGEEAPYPGHAAFLEPLSAVEALPPTWQAILRSARGIYSLTCPRDRQHYVGAADGADGFLGRWLAHAHAGGDAVELRERDASDYLVGILEVAGSFATSAEIAIMEQRWKLKLQSRSIGLNRN